MVQALLAHSHCQLARIRGCAVGLVDDVGVPIAKPWHVWTNDACLWSALESRRYCPGHLRHSECEGKYAPASENYTPEMARLIHEGWVRSVEQSWIASPARGGASRVSVQALQVPIAALPADDVRRETVRPRCVGPPLRPDDTEIEPVAAVLWGVEPNNYKDMEQQCFLLRACRPRHTQAPRARRRPGAIVAPGRGSNDL